MLQSLFNKIADLKHCKETPTQVSVFLTQIISCQQKMLMQKLHNGFHVSNNGIHVNKLSKNCIFPNIKLRGVVNRLSPFKKWSDHTNRFLMG